MSGARTAAGALLAAVGALVLGGAVMTSWVFEQSVREVGGVPLTETAAVSGAELSAFSLPLAILAVVLAVVALALPAGRRAVGTLLAVCAVAALLGVGAGAWEAYGAPGRVTAAPFAAAAGASMVLGGGLLLLRRDAAPAPALGERYTVEGAPPDDAEWELAADESDGSGPPVG